MRFALKLHPESICEAVTGIEVEVAQPGGGKLALLYVVTGRIGDLSIPPPAPAERTDGLWQRTCFEAFLGRGQGYLELNFSPSGQWAAYRFDSYRAGMTEAQIGTPEIRTRRSEDIYELEASLAQPLSGPLQLALAAVIEEANGRKSYWALAHPPGKADFHHPDSFAHRLP
jgi:hypothetical protein